MWVGALPCNKKKISRAERSWTNPLNALQEAIHYSFIKYCIFCFSLWYEFFEHYALRVRKNYQHGLDTGPSKFQFLRPRGCLTKPFRSLSLCFRVTGKTPVLISYNNFVKKIFVCIHHHDNVLARCDSIFPLLRYQGVWNKTWHNFCFPNPLSESKELQSWGCLKILLSFLLQFGGHFVPNQWQQQCLSQFKSILDSHLSRHHLPAPFRLEIENTTLKCLIGSDPHSHKPLHQY